MSVWRKLSDSLGYPISIVVSGVVYLTVEFARPGLSLPPLWIAVWMFLLFPGFWLLDFLRDSGSDGRAFGIAEGVWRALRLGILLIVGGSVAYVGWHVAGFVLWQVVWHGGYIYIVLIFSVVAVLARTQKWVEKRPYAARHAWVIGVCISVSLTFLSILTYATWVYPYVPATRGGGDYTVTANVALRLRDENGVCQRRPETCPSESGLFKIIDATQDSLFVADITSGQGAASWRIWPYRDEKQDYVPVVLEIPRSRIATIVYCRFGDSAPCSIR